MIKYKVSSVEIWDSKDIGDSFGLHDYLIWDKDMFLNLTDGEGWQYEFHLVKNTKLNKSIINIFKLYYKALRYVTYIKLKYNLL